MEYKHLSSVKVSSSFSAVGLSSMAGVYSYPHTANPQIRSAML